MSTWARVWRVIKIGLFCIIGGMITGLLMVGAYYIGRDRLFIAAPVATPVATAEPAATPAATGVDLDAAWDWAYSRDIAVSFLHDECGTSAIFGPGLTESQVNELIALTNARAVNSVTMDADGREIGNPGYVPGYLRIHLYDWRWTPAYNAVQPVPESRSPSGTSAETLASGYAPGQGNQVAQPFEVTDTTQGGCESTFPIALVGKAAEAAGCRAEIQSHNGTCVVALEGIAEEADAHAALGVLKDAGALEIAFVDLAARPDGLIEPNPGRMDLCPWGREHTVLNIYRQGQLHVDDAQRAILCQN